MSTKNKNVHKNLNVRKMGQKMLTFSIWPILLMHLMKDDLLNDTVIAKNVRDDPQFIPIQHI